MSDIKLIIDGKTYICKLEEEGTYAAVSERPRTGYERVNKCEPYYYTNDDESESMTEDYEDTDDALYENGNYYNDERLAFDVARAETLMRRLRQWQALNDKAVDWINKNEKWCIVYNHADHTIETEMRKFTQDLGQIYFSSCKKACEAIKVFHDELMWYFTEYHHRLDEPKGRM